MNKPTLEIVEECAKGGDSIIAWINVGLTAAGLVAIAVGWSLTYSQWKKGKIIELEGQVRRSLTNILTWDYELMELIHNTQTKIEKEINAKELQLIGVGSDKRREIELNISFLKVKKEPLITEWNLTADRISFIHSKLDELPDDLEKLRSELRAALTLEAGRKSEGSGLKGDDGMIYSKKS